MSLKGLSASLGSISKEFASLEDERETVLKDSRDVTTACRKAIGDIHAGRLKDAGSKLGNADTLLAILRRTNPELKRYLVPPETELVEAYMLLNILTRSSLPTRNSLKVESASYLLGLLDALGEVKRLAYDSIRRGESGRASKLFEQMETLFVSLTPFAVYDHLAHGIKKKLDVARNLLEHVRAAVTEEARRAELLEAVRNLSAKLPETRKSKRKPT